MISLEAKLRELNITDPKQLLFFTALAEAVDRLNVNFRMETDQETALLSDRPGFGERYRAGVVNLLPDVLIVKALRFLGDRHGLLLESAESMGCRTKKTVDAPITNNTWTTVTFDAEYWDTDEMHDTVSLLTRVSFDHEGKYIIGARAAFAADTSGDRGARIVKNGPGGPLLDLDLRSAAATAGLATTVECCTVYHFVKSDFIQLEVFQNSGSALDLVHVDEYAPILWAHRLS